MPLLQIIFDKIVIHVSNFMHFREEIIQLYLLQKWALGTESIKLQHLLNKYFVTPYIGHIVFKELILKKIMTPPNYL